MVYIEKYHTSPRIIMMSAPHVMHEYDNQKDVDNDMNLIRRVFQMTKEKYVVNYARIYA